MKPKVGSLLRLTGLINPLLSVYNFRRSMEVLCVYESRLKARCKVTLPLHSLILFTARDPVPCAHGEGTPRRSPGTSPAGWCPARGTASGSARPRSRRGGCRGCRRGSWPTAPAPARRPSRSGPELRLQWGRETRQRVKGHERPQVLPLLAPDIPLLTPDRAAAAPGRGEARLPSACSSRAHKKRLSEYGMYYDTTL